jgi:toluene monooxygenase system ferredoxin subunit
MPRFRLCADELWDGEMDAFEVGGVEVLLVKVDGHYCAYQGSCPHQSMALVEGELKDGLLTCRAHLWQFDARTGRGVNPQTACLRRFPLTVTAGEVFVELEEEAEVARASAT